MSRLKVVVEKDFCQGHAVCMGEAPEVFEVNEAGENTLLMTVVEGDLVAKVEAAAQYCPNRAIELIEN